MDRKASEILFALIRAEILHTDALRDEQRAALSDAETVKVLYELAQQHDLAHLVGHSLFESGLHGAYKPFERAHMMAVFRQEGMSFALDEIREALEGAEIPFIPLKGALIRDLYPEPWMRTSCDVDVLVHREDAARAATCLAESLGYRVEEESPHDISLFSDGGVHIELHFSLVNENKTDAASAILRSAWDYAAPLAGRRFEYGFSDAFFYFYHVAHMARHFAAGGCGIRSFLDLWLLDREAHNGTARAEMIERGGLSTFFAAAERLTHLWFSGEGSASDDLLSAMEKFTLFGGAYGSKHNYVTLQQKKQGGKFGYLLSRMFIPYGQMKYIYPILKKIPLLLPVFWVWRWAEHLLRGGARRSLDEIRFNQALSAKDCDDVTQMMRSLQL